MSKLILVIDGPYMTISGLDSIIYRHEAIMSVVETMISTTQTDFSKADAIISAFATRFLAAEITMPAAEKIKCLDNPTNTFIKEAELRR